MGDGGVLHVGLTRVHFARSCQDREEAAARRAASMRSCRRARRADGRSSAIRRCSGSSSSVRMTLPILRKNLCGQCEQGLAQTDENVAADPIT